MAANRVASDDGKKSGNSPRGQIDGEQHIRIETSVTFLSLSGLSAERESLANNAHVSIWLVVDGWADRRYKGVNGKTRPHLEIHDIDL